MSSTNDCKNKTRSTAPRLGLTAPAGLIPNAVLGTICELGGLYDAKPGPGGMTAYPPMTMAAVCIMPGAGRTTYRKIAGIPRNNRVCGRSQAKNGRLTRDQIATITA